MATKKAKAEKEEVEEVKAPAPEPEPTADPVTLKANEILGLIDADGELYGVTLDMTNPNHLLVAAWLVGQQGLLRK